MLPPELTKLERALKGRHCYTFAGDAKMCRELEDMDALLEQIRRASNLADVQAAIDQVMINRFTAGLPRFSA